MEAVNMERHIALYAAVGGLVVNLHFLVTGLAIPPCGFAVQISRVATYPVINPGIPEREKYECYDI